MIKKSIIFIAFTAVISLLSLPYNSISFGQETVGSENVNREIEQTKVKSATIEGQSTEQNDENESTSLFRLFLKGGIVMWPILILFAIAMGISIERYLFFRKQQLGNKEFIIDLEKYIKSNDISEMKNICNSNNSATGRVIRKGIDVIDHGLERVEKTLSVAGSIEVSALERGLNMLSAIGNIAPMLGFMGTVYGMIKAFGKIAAADHVNARIVAGGIEIALFTTFAGLAVAIPTLLLYNYFVHRVDNYVTDIDRLSSDIVETMLDK